ncbi:MAG: DoxX family protein [Myxococcales bacterium]|nr:DoxX family protein [Myxococcales bacterium]
MASGSTTKMEWVGRGLSAAASLMFLFSGVMKVIGGPDVAEGMATLGLPVGLVTTFAVIELASVLLYMIPQTAVLGAILLAGYMGGAILTHLRVGDPIIIQIVLGIVVWLGLYLREPRLRELLPLRR